VWCVAHALKKSFGGVCTNDNTKYSGQYYTKFPKYLPRYIHAQINPLPTLCLITAKFPLKNELKFVYVFKEKATFYLERALDILLQTSLVQVTDSSQQFRVFILRNL
jgi:hypothetical protein